VYVINTFNAVAPTAHGVLYRSMPPTLAQRFGRAVRQFRKAAGYSQERFAAAAKIDRAYYSRIERGHVNVSLEIIQRIVKTLRINHGDLFHAVDAE
jgi:transcriptional regulator with XRE-family HTH domain